MHLNKKIVFIKEEKQIEGVCKGINSQGHIKLEVLLMRRKHLHLELVFYLVVV
jgi:hypothetical protein